MQEHHARQARQDRLNLIKKAAMTHANTPRTSMTHSNSPQSSMTHSNNSAANGTPREIPAQFERPALANAVVAGASAVDIIGASGWDCRLLGTIPAREARYTDAYPDAMHETAKACGRTLAPNGLYLHQKKALDLHVNAHNVCLTTGTGSGKTNVFRLAGIHVLMQDGKAVILAIYPTNALVDEQFALWQEVACLAGLDADRDVVLFNGQDGMTRAARIAALRRARILVTNADTLHARIMGWLGDADAAPAARAFLRKLRLVVLDEAHLYRGAFGSQSAFLFRRMRHHAAGQGGAPLWIAASATISNPGRHLGDVVGDRFAIVDEDDNTAPRHAKRIWAVRPRREGQLLEELGRCWSSLAASHNNAFLAFVDSRIQAEHGAIIGNRAHGADDALNDINALERQTAERDDAVADKIQEIAKSFGMDRRVVQPYRSGFNREQRREIQDNLRAGRLGGVIATAALEVGIDLPDLTTGFLVGIPANATSLHQRLGRFGRHAESDIFVVHDGSSRADRHLSSLEALIGMPCSDGTLYLDNSRIQAMQLLCLASEEGWDADELSADGWEARVDFPPSFTLLVQRRLRGELLQEVEDLDDARRTETPQLRFPLRSVDIQFKLNVNWRGNVDCIGTIYEQQMLREAYPGAVYYHKGTAYRVLKVSQQAHEITLIREKQYFTEPVMQPARVQPRLTDALVLEARGDCHVADASCRVLECVMGFEEKRGPQKFNTAYPLNPKDYHGCRHDAPRICRQFGSTGVFLMHPALSALGADDRQRLAEALLEAFRICVPIESGEVAAATGRWLTDAGELKRGTYFIGLYDRTVGSLRLSSHLGEESKHEAVMARFVELASAATLGDDATLDAAAVPVARAMAESILGSKPRRVSVVGGAQAVPATDSQTQRVLLPGSKGINANGCVISISDVRFIPSKGLCYCGRFDHAPAATMMPLPVDAVQEFIGDEALNRWGLYNLETGELQDDAQPLKAS